VNGGSGVAKCSMPRRAVASAAPHSPCSPYTVSALRQQHITSARHAALLAPPHSSASRSRSGRRPHGQDISRWRNQLRMSTGERIRFKQFLPV